MCVYSFEVGKPAYKKDNMEVLLEGPTSYLNKLFNQYL